MTSPSATRKKFRTLAATMIRCSAATADLVVRPPSGIVILAYHRIGAGTDSLIDMPLEDFRLQMQYLATHHRVITLDAAVESLRSGQPEPAVVLTFDDGTSDFVEHALPVLVGLGLASTVYVATGFVDRGRDNPWGAPAMSWGQVAEAESTGLVHIEGHTHAHLVMDKLTAAAARRDLERSNELIAERVGRRPRHFAYPKGVIGNAGVERVVRELYDSAAGGQVGVNTPDSDFHRLYRSPIQTIDRGLWFTSKAAGGLALEGRLRTFANRFRYRETAA